MVNNINVEGLVVGVRTTHKGNKEGEIEHRTRITIEVEDLSRDALDALARAEVIGRLLAITLLPSRDA